MFTQECVNRKKTTSESIGAVHLEVIVCSLEENFLLHQGARAHSRISVCPFDDDKFAKVKPTSRVQARTAAQVTHKNHKFRDPSLFYTELEEAVKVARV